MKREDIKDIKGLAQFYFENTPVDTKVYAWKEYLNSEYVVPNSEEYDEYLYSYPQNTYRDFYFIQRVRFEVASSNSVYDGDKDDVQTFIKEFDERHKYTQQDLAQYLNRLYMQGLSFAGEILKMSNIGVSKEVLYHHLDSFLEYQIEEFHKEWEISSERELLALLISFVTNWILDRYTDHYVWCENYAKSLLETTETLDKDIKSFKWIGSASLDEVLEHLSPLAYLFAENSLEGLKKAFRGGNVRGVKGCLKPSYRNKTAVLFLLYNLLKNEVISEVQNIDEVVSELTGSGSRYTKQKSLFYKGEYTLDQKKEDQILSLINTIPE